MKKLLLTLVSILIYTSSYASNLFSNISAHHKMVASQSSKNQLHKNDRKMHNPQFYGKWQGSCNDGNNSSENGEIILLNISSDFISVGFEDFPNEIEYFPLDTLKTSSEVNEWGAEFQHAKAFLSEDGQTLNLFSMNIDNEKYHNNSFDIDMSSVKFHLEDDKLIGTFNSIYFENIEMPAQDGTGSCTFNRIK